MRPDEVARAFSRVAARLYSRRDPSSKITLQRHPRMGFLRAEGPLSGVEGQSPSQGELRGGKAPSYSSSPFSMAAIMSMRRWWRPPSNSAVSQWVAIILARSTPTTRAPMVRMLELLWRLESSAE